MAHSKKGIRALALRLHAQINYDASHPEHVMGAHSEIFTAFKRRFGNGVRVYRAPGGVVDWRSMKYN
jgi:hypothetical protein